MTSPYPYSRTEECGWQPEEVGRHMAGLAVDSVHNEITATSQLLSHGWSSRQVENIRQRYGSNRMTGDKSVECDDEPLQVCGFQLRCRFHQISACVLPVCVTLASQVKEPLNLMLLGSAGISIILGNAADAISIGIELLIV